MQSHLSLRAGAYRTLTSNLSASYSPLTQTIHTRASPRSQFRPQASAEVNQAGSGQGSLESGTRFYVLYSVYKKNAAVQFSFIPPQLERVGVNGVKVAREGVMLLQFANGQDRVFDWEKKLTVSLSVTELSRLLEDPTSGHEFFHDPGMASDTKGQVQKRLILMPMPNKNGVFFNLSVKEPSRNTESKVSVPVDSAEYGVVKRIAAYAIPRLLGFQYLLEPF